MLDILRKIIKENHNIILIIFSVFNNLSFYILFYHINIKFQNVNDARTIEISIERNQFINKWLIKRVNFEQFNSRQWHKKIYKSLT